MKHCFAIAAYGESPYLEACIRSLKEQKVPTEIVLCTSTPSPFLLRLASRYEIPCYVREGKSSLKDDWNFAVETAVRETGAELVTIAHQDDLYMPDYTRALRVADRLYPDFSVFCTRYQTINENGQEITGLAENVKRILRLPLRLRKLADRTWIKRLSLSFGNAIGCSTCTYRVSLTGFPVFLNDGRFALDWLNLLRFSILPGRFVCLEKELVRYRVHPDAETRKNIDNHVREQEEGWIFRFLWPRPVAALLMHFYKRAYRAYLPEKKDQTGQTCAN